MGRAFFVTPVYIFSSIRAGSGKASLLANFAVFQNNAGNKVAIIDLDSGSPQKLKNAFPQSVHIHEYPDLNQIVNNNESRYQRTFYFTETEQISYFPAMNLLRPEQLFHDTGMRDFFLQTRATFDVLLVNFPAGDKFCLAVSQILSHLWQGNPPISIIVSTSELNSLVKLDGITRKLPGLSFQLRENTLIVFNRVPGSLEEQKLSDTALTAHEIKRIFKYPNLFFIGHNEEFPHQKNIAAPIVLKSDSLINLSISRLNRQLQNSGQFDNDNEEGDFFPCLDGPLLEKLSPYLEKLQESAASELMTNPANVQVFLEESQGKYRVRLRLTGRQERLLRIPEKIEQKMRQKSVIKPSPGQFLIYQHALKSKKMPAAGRESIGNLQAKPVYRFNDCFDQQVKKFANLAFAPKRNRFPSPIVFRFAQLTKDIPTLSQILGFVKKQYARFPFVANPQIFSIPGVTHFFIPPEFELNYDKACAYVPQIFASFTSAGRHALSHENAVVLAYELPDYPIISTTTLPDLFARSQPLCLPQDSSLPQPDKNESPLRVFHHETSSFVVETASISNNCSFFFKNLALQRRKPEIIPKILALSESSGKNDGSESYSRTINWFAKKIHDFTPLITEQQMLPSEFCSGIDLSLVPVEQNFSSVISGIEASKKLEISLQLAGNSHSLPSPQIFHHSETEKQLGIIEPAALQLPGIFKTELELLDHKLNVDFIKFFEQNTRIDTRKVCKNIDIDFKTFFRALYSDNNAVYRAQAKVKQKFPETFRQKIRPLTQSFKSIFMGLPATDFLKKWDILQIHLIATKDADYKTMPGPTALSCNQVVDESLRLRNFSTSKSGMLEIHAGPATVTFTSSLPALKKVTKLQWPGHALKNDLFNDPVFPVFSSISFDRKKARQNFAPPDLQEKTISGDHSHFIVSPGLPPSFAFLYPVLYVTSFHLQKFDLFFNSFAKDVDEISQTDLTPVDAKASLNVVATPFFFNLEPYEVKLNTSLPMRLKKQELPTIADTDLSNLIKRIIIPDSRLKKANAPVARASFTSDNRRSASVARPLSMPRHYPLFKSSLEVCATSAPTRRVFRVPPPQPLEEIYQNLIRQARLLLKANLPMTFTTFSIRPVDFLINHNFKRLQFKEGIYFVRRILHSPEKIKFTGDRVQFKIINPKLKDLFKLARQTSIMFNEVNIRSGT